MCVGALSHGAHAIRVLDWNPTNGPVDRVELKRHCAAVERAVMLRHGINVGCLPVSWLGPPEVPSRRLRRLVGAGWRSRVRPRGCPACYRRLSWLYEAFVFAPGHAVVAELVDALP